MLNRKLTKYVLALPMFVCLCLSAGIARSATRDDAAAAGRIIQNQQENLDAQGPLHRRREPVPEVPEMEPQVPDVLKRRDKCHPVDKIVLEGVTAFELSELQDQLSRFSGQCLALADINAILRQITLRYFEAGFVTSRPYIKPQDLSSRVLVVTVVEGRIATVSFRDSERQQDGSIEQSFPCEPGDILNLRDLEQGLEQLNRLQSNRVKLNLVPGKDPGTTDVLLENRATGQGRLSIAVDNNGSEGTGEVQGHAAYGYDNLFGRADYVGFTFSHDFHRNTGKDSRNFHLRYEIPSGWNLFGASYNHFNYKQTLEGGSQTFPATGTVRNLSLTASRVVFRDKQSRFSVGLVLDWKDERNYLLDVLLDSSSQRFVVLRSSAQVEHLFEKATMTASAGFHRGLDVIDAQDDSSTPPGLPQAQFSKWTADVSLDVARLFSSRLDVRSTIHGQYSADRLFSSEQVSIGSLYSVRGYKQENLAGRTGGFVRNEVSTALAAGKLLGKLGISRLEPYAGFDWGSVELTGGDREKFENLQSWTVGVKGWDARQTIVLNYSEPIEKPEQFQMSPGEFSFSFTRYF